MNRAIQLSLGIILILLGLSSCEKMEAGEGFNVTLKPGTYKVGDSVRFILEGNPDIISFYAGKTGNNYNLIDNKELNNVITLELQAKLSNAGQANQLSILVSNNFSGNVKLEDLNAATWTDITSRFTSPGVGTTFSALGTATITPEVKNNSPLYIAIKYVTKPFSVAGAWSKWELNGFTFKSTNITEEKTVLDLNLPASWTVLLSPNYELFRVTLGTSGMLFQGNATNVTEETYAWMVSKIAFPYTTTNYAGDKAIAIKSTPQKALTTYATSYQSPGTYEVVFIAKNIKNNKITETIRKIKVTIEP